METLKKQTKHSDGHLKESFGDRLEYFLDLINLSKAEFCRSTGLDQAHLYRIIKGKTEPGLETITKIVKAYSFLSLNWLVTGIGEVFNQEKKYDPGSYEILEWSLNCLEYCPVEFEDRMYSQLFKLQHAIWKEKNSFGERSETDQILLERLELRMAEVTFLLGRYVRNVYLQYDNTSPEIIDNWQSDMHKRIEKEDFSIKEWFESGNKKQQKIEGGLLNLDYLKNLKKK